MPNLSLLISRFPRHFAAGIFCCLILSQPARILSIEASSTNFLSPRIRIETPSAQELFRLAPTQSSSAAIPIIWGIDIDSRLALFDIIEKLNRADFFDQLDGLPEQKKHQSVKNFYLTLSMGKDQLSDAEHLILLTYFIEQSPFRDIKIPSSLINKLVTHRKQLSLYRLGTVAVGADIPTINVILRAPYLDLTLPELTYLWQLFHRNNPEHSDRSWEKFLDEEPSFCDYVTGAIDHLSSPVRILDAGCGTTARAITDLVAMYPNVLEGYGVDAALEIEPRALVTGYQASITSMPFFPDDFFDIIYEYKMIGYLFDSGEIEAALKEILRVLKPGGEFIIVNSIQVSRQKKTIQNIVGSLAKGRFKISHTPRLTIIKKQRNTIFHEIFRKLRPAAKSSATSPLEISI